MSRSSSIFNSLSVSLPDDRPITSIQIVEITEKCPIGFFAVNKTYDQDQDADLWREASFLKKKTERYLCLSKTAGVPGLIVKEILVLNEKGVPPEGYSLLTKTADTDQKAWRKKQLCYKLVSRKVAQVAVTDIILCNRLKKAPEGFTLAGEINGITVCYKMGNVQDTESTENAHNRPAPERPPKPPSSLSGTVYPDLDNGDHDYEILNPGYVPARPAPRPPTSASTGGSATHMLTSTYNALEGVPFIINPRFMPSSNGNAYQVPIIKARNMQQLMKDYDYSFTVERQ